MFSAELWIFWTASAILRLSVISAISLRRLQPYFRFFQIYLVFSLIITSLLAVAQNFPLSSNAYSIVFVTRCYLSACFEFMAIQEVSRQALARFPAIRAATTNTLLGLWALIAVLVGIWYMYLSSTPANRSPFLLGAIRYHDSVSVGFTLFSLVFLAFLTWMPVPMTKSLMTHAFLLSCYFISNALALFVAQDGDYSQQYLLASFMQLGGTAAVCLIWLVRIRVVEDDTFNTPRGPLNSMEAERLFARLEELNTSLSRAGRR